MKKLALVFILSMLLSCEEEEKQRPDYPLETFTSFTNSRVGDIKVPEGFKRIKVEKDSFGNWLRAISLRKDSHVYLYNGLLKRNQSAQFAVLDMPVGNRDLQQCADAVMRLRAEYLFAHLKFNEIKFTDNAGKAYEWRGGANRMGFENYLATVFGWCGSASLEKELRPIDFESEIMPGDVFIKGGFPGHAMIVVDVAINNDGEKVFMLAQGYMPAQDIHIVKDPLDEDLNPWFKVSDADDLVTPEWTFTKNQLRRW